MRLREKIDNDIKDAMKKRDQGALRALRAIKAAILLALTSENRTNPDLSEEEEFALLTKQVKQRRDSIDQFIKANRQDLATTEQEELVVIEMYLPKAMSAEELANEIRAIVAEVGATTPQDFGKVMKAASQKLKGKADGKVISEAVTQVLKG